MSETNRTLRRQTVGRPFGSQAKVSAVDISIGDLVGAAAGSITGASSGATITAGSPFPASDTPWDTNLATTQEAFHDAFLGVAISQSVDTSVDPVLVDCHNAFEFDCASATFALGALVGPAKQSGNLLEDQKVVAVATPNLAIGRVARAYPSATTKVFVQLLSTVMMGGAQTPA